MGTYFVQGFLVIYDRGFSVLNYQDKLINYLAYIAIDMSYVIQFYSVTKVAKTRRNGYTFK